MMHYIECAKIVVEKRKLLKGTDYKTVSFTIGEIKDKRIEFEMLGHHFSLEKDNGGGYRVFIKSSDEYNNEFDEILHKEDENILGSRIIESQPNIRLKWLFV